MTNPYLDQLCAQTGMTRTEARRVTRLQSKPVTDEYAQQLGFATAEEYLADLHDFLNGQ